MFRTSLKNYYRLLPIARKTGCYPKAEKYHGIACVTRYLKHHPGVCSGFFLYFLLLTLFSTHLWEIKIVGNERHATEEIVSFLESCQLTSGSPLSAVDGNKIEKELRNYFHDIGWVSARLDGTRLLIELVEIKTPKQVITDTTPSHLTAPADGRVVSIVTRTGTPKVTANTSVSKGAILISGIVEITDDYKETVTPGAVRADGDILFEQTCHYFHQFSLQEKKWTETSKDSRYGAGIFSKKLLLFTTTPSVDIKKSSRLYVKNQTFSMTDTFQLPLYFWKKEYHDYKLTNITYSREEAIGIARKRFLGLLENFQKKGVLIIENNVTISVYNGICTCSGDIIVQKPLTEQDREIISESETD